MDIQSLSNVNEIIRHNDIKHVESMMLFGFIKGITIVLGLTFQSHFKFTYEYYIRLVQINIAIANVLELIRSQYMNLVLGLFVLFSLPLVSSRKSLYMWLSFYHSWNIIFCSNNDNLLQGVVHNILPVYIMMCMNEKDHKACLRTWTITRGICLSCIGANRMIAYFNTITILPTNTQ